MIFGIGSHLPETKVTNLPVRLKFAAARVRDEFYLDIFDTKAEAEQHAMKQAQRCDCLWAVYEVRLLGTAAPCNSVYEEMK